MKAVTMWLIATTILILSACSGKPQPADIHQKIQSEATLTQDEYSVMIDYVSSFLKESFVLMSELSDASNADDMQTKLDAIKAKYPFAEDFNSVIMQAEYEDKLDSDNKKKLEEWEKVIQ